MGSIQLLAVLVSALVSLTSRADGLPYAPSFPLRLAEAALARTQQAVTYDGRYVRITYPGGDVPSHIGVCTDVVIRAYRQVGVDLQREVHEEMRVAFDAFPQLWGLSRPDPNIDHRRVPNLRRFFERRGIDLPVTGDPADYRAGDLVTWLLAGRLPHIGIVVAEQSPGGQRPLIVHNIGEGPELADVLFSYPITGHYRYLPDTGKRLAPDQLGATK